MKPRRKVFELAESRWIPEPTHIVDRAADPPVCSHGEAPGCCDQCRALNAVDAYDAGWFDEH